MKKGTVEMIKMKDVENYQSLQTLTNFVSLEITFYIMKEIFRSASGNNNCLCSTIYFFSKMLRIDCG